jgi:hypothetical protein
MDSKSGRDEFNERTIRILQERVGNRCSNPNCRVPTSGPHREPNKALRIGRAAHITAAASGGPRFDPTLTASQRSDAANGIWLCGACADLVDKDEEQFPVAMMQQWKREAEAAASRGIKSAPTDPPHVPNQNSHPQNSIECPFCHTISESDVQVCVGCLADVFHGSTPSESQGEFLLAAAATFVLLLLIVQFIFRTLDQLELTVAFPLGPRFYVYIILSVVPALLTGRFFATHMDRERRKRLPRFFRKVTNF